MAARFSLEFHRVSSSEPFPTWLDREAVVKFLEQQLDERGVDAATLRAAMDHALAPTCGKGGFMILASIGERLAGATVVLRRGLAALDAGYRLAYVGVLPELRGRGLGKRLVGKVAQQATGGVEVVLEDGERVTSLFAAVGFEAAGVLYLKA